MITKHDDTANGENEGHGHVLEQEARVEARKENEHGENDHRGGRRGQLFGQLFHVERQRGDVGADLIACFDFVIMLPRILATTLTLLFFLVTQTQAISQATYDLLAFYSQLSDIAYCVQTVRGPTQLRHPFKCGEQCRKTQFEGLEVISTTFCSLPRYSFRAT